MRLVACLTVLQIVCKYFIEAIETQKYVKGSCGLLVILVLILFMKIRLVLGMS